MSTLLKHTIKPEEMTVALLCGGDSTERDISLASGQGAKAALEKAGFGVIVVDPADEENMTSLETLAAYKRIQAAFLCVHGKGGEDGVLQQKLEDMGLPYTFSGVEASRNAMNKARSKAIYEAAGIVTPASVTLVADEDYNVDDVVKKVGEHAVAKAAEGGSTLGVFIAETAKELPECIAQAFEYDPEVVVEQFIAGNEFTVAVIGNEDMQALPVIQIIPKDGFYDFEAKYSTGGSQHLCPAPIDEELTHKMQEAALKAHRALGCSGVSRSDFIVDADGQHWILETNTIPGMTQVSLLPDAAAAAGISFDELCTYFLELAMER